MASLLPQLLTSCFFLIAVRETVTETTDTLRLQVSTWNVNRRPPLLTDYSSLFGFSEDPLPDLVAVALQEGNPTPNFYFKKLKGLRIFKYIIDICGARKKEFYKNFMYFIRCIEKLLKSKSLNYIRNKTEIRWREHLTLFAETYNYSKVASKKMSGIILIIFAKNDLAAKCKKIGSFNKHNGAGHIMPNKGGVVIKLKCYRTKLTFVATHLKDGITELEERIKDYKYINKKLDEEDQAYTFWFGDLNFRLIDVGLSNIMVIEKINKVQNNCFDPLLLWDELNKCRNEKKVFVGYDEMPIKFPPTYKYVIGTSNYDQSRRPAWTDRILYKTHVSGHKIEPLFYDSIKELKYSDHFPVVAQFLISIDKRTSESTEIITDDSSQDEDDG